VAIGRLSLTCSTRASIACSRSRNGSFVMSIAGVVATTPRPVSIGGLDGQVIDVAVAPGWAVACPFTDGVPSVPLFLDDNVADEPAFWGVTGPERLRLMVLDDRHSSNVVVMIDSTSGTTLDALDTTARPVLDTFEFAVGD
jgi:hypothetical protein